MRLQGTVTIGNKVDNITADLFWKTSTVNARNITQVELLEYRNNVLESRSVADSDTLWSYNLINKEYSATAYGTYKTVNVVNPTDYQRDLLAYLNVSSKGFGTSLTKLLRQIFDGDVPNYQSWIPVAPAVEVDAPDDNQISYTYGNPIQKKIIFDVDDADKLNWMTFYDKRKVGRQDRETIWTLTVLASGLLPSNVNFTPYTSAQIRGWRPVVAPKPVRF